MTVIKKRGSAPARQLGRVREEEWNLLKSAAKNRGESFTAWALAILTREAKREMRKSPCSPTS